MIITTSEWATSTISESYNDKTNLGECLVTRSPKSNGERLSLRAWIYIRNDGVFLIWIKIEGFPHDPVQVGCSIGGFDGEGFRYFPAQFGGAIYVDLLQLENNLSRPISKNRACGSINGGDIVHKV